MKINWKDFEEQLAWVENRADEAARILQDVWREEHKCVSNPRDHESHKLFGDSVYLRVYYYGYGCSDETTVAGLYLPFEFLDKSDEELAAYFLETLRAKAKADAEQRRLDNERVKRAEARDALRKIRQYEEQYGKEALENL